MGTHLRNRHGIGFDRQGHEPIDPPKTAQGHPRYQKAQLKPIGPPGTVPAWHTVRDIGENLSSTFPQPQSVERFPPSNFNAINRLAAFIPQHGASVATVWSLRFARSALIKPTARPTKLLTTGDRRSRWGSLSAVEGTANCDRPTAPTSAMSPPATGIAGLGSVDFAKMNQPARQKVVSVNPG